MSTDIKLLDGEIVLGYEDLELVESSECLLQDIRNRLFTDIGALYYDPSYGGRVLRYIHGSRNNLTIQELKQTVKIVLKKDERIVSNSIKISIVEETNNLIIHIQFISSDNEKLETKVIL